MYRVKGQFFDKYKRNAWANRQAFASKFPTPWMTNETCKNLTLSIFSPFYM